MGAWIIVIINLLMAFGAIGVFTRMTPAIANIMSNNERSLKACEEMLFSLAMSSIEEDREAGKKSFLAALQRAIKNITEKEESEALADITKSSVRFFAGETEALKETVAKIIFLSEINRNAMTKADIAAQQLGRSGAWGIVFMAIFALLGGIIFIANLHNKLLQPLEEMKLVLQANQQGEAHRRCAGINLPSDIKNLYGQINKLLDRTIHQNFNNFL